MGAPVEEQYGAWAKPDGSGRWRVWAPFRDRVELVLVDGERRRPVPMAAGPFGHFAVTLRDVPDGQRYLYRLRGGAARPDPASRWQPDGVDGPSAVVGPLPRAAGWAGVPRPDRALYELHIGTFTPEGTFDAIAPGCRS